MKNDYTYLVSLNDFCARFEYGDKFRERFRQNLINIEALVNDNGIEYISLGPYMNFTLDGLELSKIHTHDHQTLKNILDYDSVCRIYLEEWIKLSAEIQRPYASRPAYIYDTDFLENMSKLTASVKMVVEYFLDAQDIILAGPTSD
jgi:hypothetical protein